MKVIIDRFEEDIAVVELDGEMLKAPRALFADAREGDTVELRVLPRKETVEKPADASSLADIVRNAVQTAAESPAPADDDDPAAMFKKLRNKRKKPTNR